MSQLSIRFGSELRRLRQARGWSQEYLAGLAEINRSFIGEVERGRAVPSLDTLVKLAEALHLSVSDLLAGVHRVSPPRPDPAPIGGDRRLNGF